MTIDPAEFRAVLGHYPTGVAVVAANLASGPVGMVVGSFTSVSLDPPLVAFLPQRNSSTYGLLRQAQTLCVSILSADQESLCRRFSSRSVLDKWAGVARQWAAGKQPPGLRYVGKRGKVSAGRDVFLFFINGAKERAPAGAQALIARLGTC